MPERVATTQSYRSFFAEPAGELLSPVTRQRHETDRADLVRLAEDGPSLRRDWYLTADDAERLAEQLWAAAAEARRLS